MIKPLALYIGLRYTRAKRRNHFISFISLASMIGIALGVMVLITVLSVMNGFDYQIRTRFFAIAPQVTVVSSQKVSAFWPRFSSRINNIPGVQGVAPYVEGKGMLINAGQINGVQAVGINPNFESHVSDLGDKVTSGSLSSLTPNAFHIIIGQKLATNLGLVVGSKINLFTPDSNITLAGIFPRYKTFTVSGIFKTSGGFGFESQVVFLNIRDAARLFSAGQMTSGLHIRLENLYDANLISQQIKTILPDIYSVTNWTQQFGAFFQALAMEKTMLFVILLLIVAVAVFNLVSTLVMVVNDKRADIAILRTLGARPTTIMSTFIVQGAIVGLIGTIIGVIFGLLLASNVTAITNFIQRAFNVQFVSSSVYFINYLPSRIQVSDVLEVAGLAFLLSLLATLYPAFIAFRTQPAEALRYE